MKELKVLEYLKKEISFLSNAISYNEQNGVSTDHLKINLSKINEAIKEFEELNNRSCIKCNTYYMKCKIFNVYWKKSESSLIIDSSSFYCNKYEPKQ